MESSRTLRVPDFCKVGSIILFQGDSITEGLHRGDMNHIYGHGFVWEIASRYQAYRPELKLEFANRGISGNSSSDLLNRWATDAFPFTIDENGYSVAFGRKKGDQVMPDMVSILVGINDYFYISQTKTRGITVEGYEANLRKLIEMSRAANPAVKIVLCEPFRLPVDTSEEFCRRQEVVAKLARELDCIFVPFQKLFTEELLKINPDPGYWIWDFCHATPAAHYLMANFWIETVSSSYKP